MDTNLDKMLSIRTADLLGLADAHRWTVIRTIRGQSVAEHAFAVAVIAMELLDRFGEDDPNEQGRLILERDVLWWAIAHDAPETLTGDIDGRFKREFPVLAVAIRDAEDVAFPWYKGTREMHAGGDAGQAKWIVKTADKIEAIVFIRQWGIGDRADSVYHELVDVLKRETIAELAEALGEPVERVDHVVNMVMNRILSQTMNYQSRNRWASKMTDANRM